METEKFYSVPEAARFLGGISKWTVYAWISKGKIRKTKIGSRTMVSEQDLRAFVERCNADRAS